MEEEKGVLLPKRRQSSRGTIFAIDSKVTEDGVIFTLAETNDLVNGTVGAKIG